MTNTVSRSNIVMHSKNDHHHPGNNTTAAILTMQPVQSDQIGLQAVLSEDSAIFPKKTCSGCILTIQKAISKENKVLAPKKKQFHRWVEAALQCDAEITIRLVDEEEGKTLNQQFRGKNNATNVLSFSYGSTENSTSSTEPLCGDLVICASVVAREAAEQGKSIEAHYAHLVIHGILHLQGYDHENNKDAEIMETIESRILISLGYADPYSPI